MSTDTPIERLLQFLDTLNINPVTDQFSCMGTCGIGIVEVRTPGTYREIRFKIDGDKIATFDPRDLSKEERNALMLQLMQTSNFSQTEVARLLGISLVTVSRAWIAHQKEKK